MNALSLTYMVLTRALIASLYGIIGLASILPLPYGIFGRPMRARPPEWKWLYGIFGRPMRACPPEWKWLFTTLQRYNVKHKHNQGKRFANGIVVKRAEMLRHPCILGGPQTTGDKISSQNVR